jgi:hypothetical protein
MKMINESHGKNHFTPELSLLGWFGEGKPSIYYYNPEL